MSWLLRLFARKRMEIDLDKELRFHFETQVADKVRSGIPEREAVDSPDWSSEASSRSKKIAGRAEAHCGSNRSCGIFATRFGRFGNRQDLQR
jgi:hypothetical protein